MARVEEHRDYLWHMEPIVSQRGEGEQDASGVVGDEWATDVSGVGDGSVSSADIELRGAHGAHRRKHMLGQTQSNAELRIAPPSHEDTRSRAVKPVLTDEIALDQAVLDAKERLASASRAEEARQQALEASAATANESDEEKRLTQRQSTGGKARVVRKPTHSGGAPMRTPRAQPMDDEVTAPQGVALKPVWRGRR